MSTNHDQPLTLARLAALERLEQQAMKGARFGWGICPNCGYVKPVSRKTQICRSHGPGFACLNPQLGGLVVGTIYDTKEAAQAYAKAVKNHKTRP